MRCSNWHAESHHADSQKPGTISFARTISPQNLSFSGRFVFGRIPDELPVVAHSLLLALVAISAPAATETELSAAVAGCNQVLTASSCVVGRATAPGDWQAEITWPGAPSIARLEVTRRAGDESTEAVVQEVQFAEADPPEQRYQALGVIVAARVLARAGSAESGRVASEAAPESLTKSTPPSAPPPPPPPSAKRPPESPPEPEQRSRPGLALDLALLATPSLERSPMPAWGALIRGQVGLGRSPVAALLDVRWAHAEAQLVENDGSFGLGLACSLTPVDWPLGLALHAEGTASAVTVSAIRNGDQEEGMAWRGGARLGLDASMPLHRGWRILLGGDVGVLGPRMAVEVAKQTVGTRDLFEFQAFAGLRWAP